MIAIDLKGFEPQKEANYKNIDKKLEYFELILRLILIVVLLVGAS